MGLLCPANGWNSDKVVGKIAENVDVPPMNYEVGVTIFCENAPFEAIKINF